MIHSPRPSAYQRIYQDITEKVMAALRQGNIIWRKPWSSTSNTLPTNFISKKRYRGWNLFFLSWMMQEKGYTSPYFLTFHQTQLLGGRIRIGSKGLPVIKWVESSKKPGTDESDQATTAQHIYPITHIVFNVSQTEGIDYSEPTDPPLAKSNPILSCENLLARMKQLPLVQPNSGRAAYSKIHDRIFMPARDSFHPPEEYYSTIFHEVIHSTGHATRLNRLELTGPFSFGSPEYSREELTAEFGAAYLCGITGIAQQTVTNSAAYIKGWLRNLESDPTLVYNACSKAQAAIDFLLPDAEPCPIM